MAKAKQAASKKVTPIAYTLTMDKRRAKILLNMLGAIELRMFEKGYRPTEGQMNTVAELRRQLSDRCTDNRRRHWKSNSQQPSSGPEDINKPRLFSFDPLVCDERVSPEIRSTASWPLAVKYFFHHSKYDRIQSHPITDRPVARIDYTICSEHVPKLVQRFLIHA